MRLATHSLKSIFSNGTFISLAAGTASKLTGFINQIISTMLISKTLGAESFDYYLFSVSFVSWFSILLFGTNSTLPTILMHEPNDQKEFSLIVKAALIIAFCGGLAALLLTYLFLSKDIFHNTQLQLYITTSAICNFTVVIFSISYSIFIVLGKILEYYLYNAIGTIISLLLTFWFSRTHGTVTDFILSYYISIIFPLLGISVVNRRELDIFSCVPLNKLTGQIYNILIKSGSGFGFEVAAFSKLHMPVSMMGLMGFTNQIGIVGIGIRFTNLITGGLNVIFPIMILKAGNAAARKDKRGIMLWNLVGLCSGVLLSSITAYLFIVYGNEIYYNWTSGVISLHPSDKLSMAAFSALYVFQEIMFRLAMVDPKKMDRLKYIFWFECLFIVSFGYINVYFSEASHAGGAILNALALIMIMSNTFILGVVFLDQNSN